MDKELLEVRLHYIYCVYGGPDGPLEEVRDFFSLDIGEDTNVYNATEPAFTLRSITRPWTPCNDERRRPEIS